MSKKYNIAVIPGDGTGRVSGCDLHRTALKKFEKALGVGLLLLGCFQEDGRDLFEALFLGLLGKEFITVLGLGFPGKSF